MLHHTNVCRFASVLKNNANKLCTKQMRSLFCTVSIITFLLCACLTSSVIWLRQTEGLISPRRNQMVCNCIGPWYKKWATGFTALLFHIWQGFVQLLNFSVLDCCCCCHLLDLQHGLQLVLLKRNMLKCVPYLFPRVPPGIWSVKQQMH